MFAGFAKVNITPPVGMAMEGFGQPPSQAIHDDLFVRALWLEHDGEDVLIVGFDLLFFERKEIDRYKGALGRALELRPNQILLNTSHLHTGPRLTRWAYGGEADPIYLDDLECALVRAATEARATRRPVTVWAGATVTDVPISRRMPQPDGTVVWAPTRRNTVCNHLPFALFKDDARQVVALLFSVSCHPSMIYDSITSAEYPGAAMRQLNARFGTDGSLFLQGTGGDAKPRQIAVWEKEWARGTWDQMEDTGREIADAIAAAVGALTPVTPALRSRVVEMQWPLEPAPERAYLEQIAQDEEERPDRRRWSRDWARDMLDHLDRHGALRNHAGILLHYLEIGPELRLIGLEGEAVGDLGNFLLERCPTGITFPLGYTNGCQLYLPSSRMRPEGGYEVDSAMEYHYPSLLQPGMEAIIAQTLEAITAEWCQTS